MTNAVFSCRLCGRAFWGTNESWLEGYKFLHALTCPRSFKKWVPLVDIARYGAHDDW